MEHVGILGFLAVLAGVITWVGNEFFAQGWGAAVYFLILIIEIVIVYGGVLILDGSEF